MISDSYSREENIAQVSKGKLVVEAPDLNIWCMVIISQLSFIIVMLLYIGGNL